MYKKCSTISKQHPDFILITFTVIQGKRKYIYTPNKKGKFIVHIEYSPHHYMVLKKAQREVYRIDIFVIIFLLGKLPLLSWNRVLFIG